ncbi:F0F1 ATP synthase subunit A [Parabacteroides bouchesdurhonensis]|uniref:F0F1 ATP synthase subunit A n=1 Tax=Parabacteroides bouchesdurhonensis TaxID=1936995 RepID=UPI000C854C7F|nr:F0F1 ATP synthase subunit A [Parabacteroides bouchesdurhonensis]
MRTLDKYKLLLIIWLAFGWIGVNDVSAEEINVQEIVFSHIQDNYTWHITSWNQQEISIPLPIIVKSEERGWNFFIASRLHEGNMHHGFYIAKEGEHAGKVVEKKSTGEEVRPLDISITKNVLALLLSCIILTSVILGVARWYKKHPMEAPGGFVGMIEACIFFIHDGVIKDNIGKDYRKYAPYLLTVFFFILLNNLMGLIPVFPGGANVTGNIAITLVLSAITFIIVNVSGTKAYWKGIFWPETPLFLKLPFPLMPFVEFFGVFTKPFALMIRLFANIMAGHTIILGLTCLVFISVSMGAIVNGAMSIVSVVFCVFMNCIEILVACIQAYIFTLLSAVYIGLAKE